MPAVVMRDYRAEHRLTLRGHIASEGPCDVHLEDEFLLIKGAGAQRIAYQDVESVHLENSRVALGLYPEGQLVIDRMDHALVRPLFLNLSHLRGARWADLLRFVAPKLLDSLECKYTLNGEPEQEALFHLYPASLVGMPLGGEPFQIPLHEIKGLELVNYEFRCEALDGVVFLFGTEPGDIARFHRSVVAARQAQEAETADLLVRLFPSLGFADLAKLTPLLFRGRACEKRDVDSAVPWVWERMEDLIRVNAATGESYAFLRERAGAWLWFGVLRRSAEGGSGAADKAEPDEEPIDDELAPEPGPPRDFLFWFMAGLTSRDQRFMAVEIVAVSTGYATYVYRCVDGKDDGAAFGSTARILSRALVHLNFHREPLHVSQEEIDTGKSGKYRLAIRKLEYLRVARTLFVGRALHTDGWQASLEKLLV